MPASNDRAVDSHARTAVTLLALIALIGSVLLVVIRPASAADDCYSMVVDPADGAFSGDPITFSGYNWPGPGVVEVSLGGVSLGTAATETLKSWTLNATVPALSPGVYLLAYRHDLNTSPSVTVWCDKVQYTVHGVVPTLNPTIGVGTIVLPPGVTLGTITTTTTTTTAPTTTAGVTTDASGTSLVAGVVDASDGGGGTVVGVLIGFVIAAALAGAWLLGRRTTAPAAGYATPPPPPPPP